MSKEFMVQRITDSLDKLDLHFIKCVMLFVERLAS